MEKKCANCGSENLTEGVVNTSESMRVFFVSTKERKKIFPKTEKIFAFKCEACGYINHFVKIEE